MHGLLVFVLPIAALVLGFLRLPEKIYRNRIDALVRGLLPSVCFIFAGAVLFAHNALHAGDGMASAALLANIYPWMWEVLLLCLILIGIILMNRALKQGAIDRLPQLEEKDKELLKKHKALEEKDAAIVIAEGRIARANDSLAIFGSLNADQLQALELLAKWTRDNPNERDGMHIGGNDAALTALHQRAPAAFPTDGRAKISIVEACRPFAFEWLKGRQK